MLEPSIGERWLDDQTGKLYRIDPDLSIYVLDEGFGRQRTWTQLGWQDFVFLRIQLPASFYAIKLTQLPETYRTAETLFRVPTDEGMPDGVTVDADGFIWNANGMADKLFDMTRMAKWSVAFIAGHTDRQSHLWRTRLERTLYHHCRG